MRRVRRSQILRLSETLLIEPDFLQRSIEESVIEVRETDEGVELDRRALPRLRRIERVCRALGVDVGIAHLMLTLRDRVSELEDEVRALRSREWTD
ncbi:MAG: chaperone modulator CbpM [Elusimicrobiota bacterium]